MRTLGNTVAGGVVGDVVLCLPMEEREDRDAVRARREAKRGQLLARSPFAGLTTSEKAAIRAQHEKTRAVDEQLEATKFTTPDLEPAADVAPDPRPAPIVPVAVTPSPPAPALAAVPTPRPRPTRKPAERTARAHPPLDASAIVREYVEDGLTIPEIAKRRGHSTRTVRDLLKATPGVEMRDDRTTNSGGRNKAADAPEVVDAVRRLYTGAEQLTQDQVAVRLGLTTKVVQRIMRDHEIPARPAAHERAAELNRTHGNPAGLMTQRLADAGVTSKDVRAWAREHDLACPVKGVVPQRLLAAYLRADGGAPVEPDATDLALRQAEPEAEPAPESVEQRLAGVGVREPVANPAHYEGSLKDAAQALEDRVLVAGGGGGGQGVGTAGYVRDIRPRAGLPLAMVQGARRARPPQSPAGDLLRAAAQLLTAAAGVLDGERSPA